MLESLNCLWNKVLLCVKMLLRLLVFTMKIFVNLFYTHFAFINVQMSPLELGRGLVRIMVRLRIDVWCVCEVK